MATICTLKTDTEVISYLFDLLARERELSLEDISTILAPPIWEEIDIIPDRKKREKITYLRQYYPQALLNGAFAILESNGRELIALNDRSKLRPLVAAKQGDTLYFSSEECSFQILCPEREKTPPLLLKAETPILFSAMSLGSVNLREQIAEAKPAESLGTYCNTGEGGLHKDLERYRKNTDDSRGLRCSFYRAPSRYLFHRGPSSADICHQRDHTV